jgi:hypothetical protein
MAIPAVLDNFADFLRDQSDKADIFVTEYSNQTADNINKFLITLKTSNPIKYQLVSDNIRKMSDSITPNLAPTRITGGRKKRTTRRKKHKTTK